MDKIFAVVTCLGSNILNPDVHVLAMFDTLDEAEKYKDGMDDWNILTIDPKIVWNEGEFNFKKINKFKQGAGVAKVEDD
jgi:hypothetical protein